MLFQYYLYFGCELIEVGSLVKYDIAALLTRFQSLVLISSFEEVTECITVISKLYSLYLMASAGWNQQHPHH